MKKSATPEDGAAPMATLPPRKGGDDEGEPTMTKTMKQAEILQEENRELKARVAELEAKLAESRNFALERERYHQLKALGGAV